MIYSQLKHCNALNKYLNEFDLTTHGDINYSEEYFIITKSIKATLTHQG